MIKVDDLPDVMTPAMLAERLHTTTNALKRRRYLGSGPKFYRLGSRVYYSAEAVREWIGESFQTTAEAYEAQEPQR